MGVLDHLGNLDTQGVSKLTIFNSPRAQRILQKREEAKQAFIRKAAAATAIRNATTPHSMSRFNNPEPIQAPVPPVQPVAPAAQPVISTKQPPKQLRQEQMWRH